MSADRTILDDVTVYALSPERITGKEIRLPAKDAQWPAGDKTKSPPAVVPNALTPNLSIQGAASSGVEAAP